MPRLPKELTELIEIKNLILPIYEEFMLLIREYLEEHEDSEAELKKGVFYYFCVKAYQTLNAILLLIEMHHINDAYILLRSLFEVQLTNRYIYFDIPSRLNKFLNFGWIDSKRRIENGMFRVDKEQEEEIYKNYEKYKNEYKNKSHWESIKVMAKNKEVNQTVDFYTVYKYCSSLVHVNPLAQQNYFVQETDDKDVYRAFWTSLWYSLCVLDSVNDIFKLKLDKRLNEIGHMIEDYGKKHVLKII
jgi:hypothetical protein